jgi:voltage-gated potassium channel
MDHLHWASIGLVAGVHFFATWAGLAYFEPEAEFTQPEVYWWFYTVTGTTVGYGDYAPQTLGGRVVTIAVMFGGITLMGAVIGKVAAWFSLLAEKRRKGMIQLHESQHVVVICDESSRTEEVISNLMADSAGDTVVLVSTLKENPTESSEFVSGHITSKKVRKRACVSKASTVVVLGTNDAETLGRVVTLLPSLRKDARVVAYFYSQSSAESVSSLDPRVSAVVSMDMAAVVQEAQDRGASGFTRAMMDNQKVGTYFRLEVPKGVQANASQLAGLLLTQGVNLVGIHVDRGAEATILLDPGLGIDDTMDLAVLAADRSVLAALRWT